MGKKMPFMSNRSRNIIEDIISQHSEEAAFLWLLRDAAVHQPHYDLRDLAELDDRVEAHIDGLRISGDPGWEICLQTLALEEAGEVFAAAVLAFESLDEDRMQFVVEAGIAGPDLSRGLVSAMGWLSLEQAAPLIDRMLSAELAAVRRIGVAASAAHRRDPGPSLKKALFDDDLPLRARAAKAVGELGRVDLMPWLRDSLKTDEDSCRFYAAWSGTLLGQSDSLSVLRAFAVPGSTYGEEAVKVAAPRMDLPSAHAWQNELAHGPQTIRLAIICTGAMGDPASIPWLIAQMENPELARIAGESFMMVTGADIAYENLEGKKPEGFEAGPTENPEDENVEMDPDEDLPWPNIQLIEKWWGQHKIQYQNGTRVLMGKPIAQNHLQQVLRTGRQRQRAAAALEFAMLTPGRPLFEVRAPGFRQQQMLGLKRSKA